MRRLQRAAVGIAASVALAAVAAGGTASAAPRAAAAGSTVFSPYTDMSNGQEGLLDTAITQHGVKSFTAAFAIGSGCNDIWGDTLPVGGDSFTDPLIKKAQSEGADVIVSSGGSAGEPLAWTCTDQSAIQAAYQKIIDSYGVTSLDFDIEGAAVADTAAATRNWTAIKALKAANPGLQVSATLAVLPSGLTQDGVNVLKAAQSVGLKLDVVNIMTMDYYQGDQDMGAAAISAAKATLSQMQSVDSGYTYANLGITPMIGVNDDGTTFTLANAASVKSFATSNGVGRLSFWSVNRDQGCGGAAAAKPAGTASASSTCSGVAQSQLAFADAFK